MTLTLDLPSDVEDALAADARRRGTTLEGIVLQDLRQRYAIVTASAVTETTSQSKFDDPTLALFAQWEADYATDDPEELARREREGDDLMAALEANGRLSFEGRTDFSDLLDLDDEAEGEQKENAA